MSGQDRSNGSWLLMRRPQLPPGPLWRQVPVVTGEAGGYGQAQESLGAQ